MDGDRYDVFVQEYRPRFMQVCEFLRQECLEAGWQASKTLEFYGDTFSCGFQVSLPDKPIVCVDVSLLDREDFDDKDGLAFRLDIVEENGRIIGGFVPYNYTSRCWVSPDQLKKRWKIFSDGCEGIDKIIANHFQ